MTYLVTTINKGFDTSFFLTYTNAAINYLRLGKHVFSGFLFLPFSFFSLIPLIIVFSFPRLFGRRVRAPSLQKRDAFFFFLLFTFLFHVNYTRSSLFRIGSTFIKHEYNRGRFVQRFTMMMYTVRKLARCTIFCSALLRV